MYDQETRGMALARLLPPCNESIDTVSRDTGISKSALREWRDQALAKGESLEQNSRNAGGRSREEWFNIVHDTLTMGELELGEYARRHGLYVSQIMDWRRYFLSGPTSMKEENRRVAAVKREAKATERKLRAEIAKKDKLIAEAKVIEELLKKANAIWGRKEED